MNILHIAPYVSSLKANHAGGVHMGKVVETLEKNHNVYYLEFVNNDFDEKLSREKKNFYGIKTSAMTFVGNILIHPSTPNLFAIRSSRAFSKRLIDIVREKKIDIILADYTAMGQFVWIKKYVPQVKFYLVEHDVVLQSYERKVIESSGIKKIYEQSEENKVRAKEGEYLKASDEILVLNDKDLRLEKEIYGIEAKKIIPYFGFNVAPYQKRKYKEKTICFVGQMGRDENHVAAMKLIDIFKKINRKDYFLTIIGAHPKEELKACESENIHITGFVDDINEEIKKNAISVFPLTFGAGIKFKVLLSASLGLPVITTPVGAEGIDENGDFLDVISKDEEDKFIEEIIRYLDNPSYLEERAKALTDYIFTNFSFDKNEELFNKLFPNKN